MRASSKRVYSLLLSLAILVGSLLIYMLLITPTYDNIKLLRSDVANKSQALNEHRDIVQKTQQLINQYKGSENLQSTLTLSLPNEPYVSQIVADISGLASLNSLKLSGISTEVQAFRSFGDAPEYVKSVGVVKTTARAKGKYEDLRTFLTQLQTIVRIMDVRSLSISTVSGSKGASADYDYVFSALSYYQDKSQPVLQAK